MSDDDGAAHLGVWYAVLMAASRATPRGALMRGDGQPHTAESLARLVRLPQPVVAIAIDRLLKIGLLEIGGNKSRKKNELPSHPSAATPQGVAPESQKDAAEGKGTEHHHQEGEINRKKRNANRTERTGIAGNGTRAGEDSTAERSGAHGGVAAASSAKGDDADENPRV